VRSVAELSDGTGYTIAFSDNSSVTIHHGTNGTNNGRYLQFNKNGVVTNGATYRATGFSVRCTKE
jgi:hypothetical protein